MSLAAIRTSGKQKPPSHLGLLSQVYFDGFLYFACYVVFKLLDRSQLLTLSSPLLSPYSLLSSPHGPYISTEVIHHLCSLHTVISPAWKAAPSLCLPKSLEPIKVTSRARSSGCSSHRGKWTIYYVCVMLTLPRVICPLCLLGL